MSGADPTVRQVTLGLCELCIGGAGGECHVPGCALWLNRAPDMAFGDLVSDSKERELEAERDVAMADVTRLTRERDEALAETDRLRTASVRILHTCAKCGHQCTSLDFCPCLRPSHERDALRQERDEARAKLLALREELSRAVLPGAGKHPADNDAILIGEVQTLREHCAEVEAERDEARAEEERLFDATLTLRADLKRAEVARLRNACGETAGELHARVAGLRAALGRIANRVPHDDCEAHEPDGSRRDEYDCLCCEVCCETSRDARAALAPSGAT